MTKEYVEKYKIFECISGSHAYGLNTPESDVDIRKVFLSPLKDLLNPITHTQQLNDNLNDVQSYGFDKFFKLQIDQNPNIIELLWMHDKSVTMETGIWKEYKSHKYELLSKKCYHTFSGYAHSQLKRMKGHNKRINRANEFINEPRQCDYIRILNLSTGNDITPTKLPNMEILNKFGAKDLNNGLYLLFNNGFGIFDKKGNFKSNQSGEFKKDTSYIFKYNEQQWKQDHTNWKNYWEWKESRNAKRAELEEQFGYDCKHASHLIRLLTMCKYILEEGVVYVELPSQDKEIVRSIRNGKFTYEQILELSNDLENQNKKLYEISQLRDKIDIDFAIDIYYNIIMENRK